jgi:hypothetical protein
VEVNFAILKLKNNTASGPDRLNAELLKVDEMSLIHRLWKLIEMVLKEEIFSSQWEEGLICPTYKKRRSTDVRKLSYLFSEHGI